VTVTVKASEIFENQWRWQGSLFWSLKCSSNFILRYGQYMDTITGILCTAPL